MSYAIFGDSYVTRLADFTERKAGNVQKNNFNFWKILIWFDSFILNKQLLF